LLVWTLANSVDRLDPAPLLDPVDAVDRLRSDGTGLRVLHLVSSPTMTGPADPALGLARAQASLGVEVKLACDQVREGNMTAKCGEAGIEVERSLRLCTTRAFSTALGDRARLRRFADQYDVLHAHTSHDHALAAAARGRAMLVRTIHHPRATHRRGLQGWAYRRTDGLLFIAERHRSVLLESYLSIDPSRTDVIPGAVDPDRFRPDRDAGSFRETHQIPRDAFLFGMIARIKPGRGHELLLRALVEVPNAHLALIGKGEGEPEVKAQVVLQGLGDRVHFYGFRDADLPQAIRSLDASILLAEGNDASCRAVLESMACAIPVIGADLPAIREAIQGSGGGLLVPPGDRGPLVAAMRELAESDRARIEEMGRHARARILERHTDRARAERVLAFYRRLRG
jgi:glycosyltransferase involved in cell wall biosynthesis